MKQSQAKAFWNGFTREGALWSHHNSTDTDEDPWLPPPIPGATLQEDDPWAPPDVNRYPAYRTPNIVLYSGNTATPLVDSANTTTRPATPMTPEVKETPQNALTPTINKSLMTQNQPSSQSYNSFNNTASAQNKLTIYPYTPENNPKHKETQNVLESIAGGYYPDEKQLSSMGMTRDNARTIMDLLSNHLVTDAEAYNIIAIHANGGFLTENMTIHANML